MGNDFSSPRNLLWKKDPDSDLLVDLPSNDLSVEWHRKIDEEIANTKNRFLDDEFEPKKSDRVSTDFRMAGNQKFQEQKWRAAMELYNQSLRFAEKGSENVSLAYANRSSCFLRMQKYTECLNDIEMARETGYPKRLMHKLDDREARCLEKIKKGDEIEDYIEPRLSFDPDEKFPCMANVLEIKYNQEYGRHIVAKCDIDVGQTVLVEEPFVSAFDSLNQMLCFTCMMQMKNFIPCNDCTDAMFCDEKCMLKNGIHKIACGAAYYRENGTKLIVQTILTALNAFETVEQLMEFVEKELAKPKFPFPEDYTDVQMHYAMFLRLTEMQELNDLIQLKIYKYIMAIPTISARFDSVKKQRFLKHLIWQHGLFIDNQISQSWAEKSVVDGVIIRNQISGTIQAPNTIQKLGRIRALGTVQPLFNHSCDPNLFFQKYGNKHIMITTKPVKKGEQLFYMCEPQLLLASTEERQKFLQKVFNFTCKCSRCVPSGRAIDSKRMQKDRIYKYLKTYQDRSLTIPTELRLHLKDKCFQFMRKYGHLPWSNEISYVMVNLSECLEGGYPVHTINEF